MNKLYLAAAVCLFIACKFEVKRTGNEKEAEGISAKVSVSNTETKIRNDIKLETKGDIVVDQAFLVFEDGKLVPQNNQTEVDKPIDIRIIIAEGWKENNGNVSIGASEKIETSDGQVLLDEADLFKSYTNISAADARFISLTANVSRLDKLYDYFLVSFRVWDKNGPGEIKGSYKFYIQ